MPQSVAGYVHRIGRTGRAYNSGSSVSLVSFRQSPSSSGGISDIFLDFSLEPQSCSINIGEVQRSISLQNAG